MEVLGWIFASAEALAVSHGGDLKRTEDVKAANAAASRAKKQQALLNKRQKLKPLSDEQRQRLRLTFDHFDADFSGKLVTTPRLKLVVRRLRLRPPCSLGPLRLLGMARTWTSSATR